MLYSASTTSLALFFYSLIYQSPKESLWWPEFKVTKHERRVQYFHWHTGCLADTQFIEQPKSASQQNSTEMPAICGNPGAVGKAHKLALQKELQRAFNLVFPKCGGVWMLTTQTVWKTNSRHMSSIFFSVKQAPVHSCEISAATDTLVSWVSSRIPSSSSHSGQSMSWASKTLGANSGQSPMHMALVICKWPYIL